MPILRNATLVLGALVMSTPAALAADAAAPAPKPMNTITLELSPEFYAIDKSYADEGDLADVYIKAGFSHTFDSNIVVGASLQHTMRESIPGDGATTADYAEVNAGYKFKLNDAITLTPSATLGYGFGDKPDIDPDDKYGSAAYYAVSLAGDLKLTKAITWNVFNVRYRNAFDATWKTPKISTGLTYKIDGENAVYINAGKSWKDKGDGEGYVEDKLNFAVGYKYSF